MELGLELDLNNYLTWLQEKVSILVLMELGLEHTGLVFDEQGRAMFLSLF